MLRFRLFLYAAVLLICCACGDDNTSVNSSQTDGRDFQPAADGLFTPVAAAASGVTFVNEVKSDFSFNHVNYPYLFNGAGVGVIDYDNDGLQDLYFVSNQEDNKLYRNLGDFKFEDVSAAAGLTESPGFDVGVSIADVDGDGFQDIYLSRTGIDNTPAGKQARENLLYRNNGDGTFTESAAAFGLNSNRPATQATFFDYDRDGDLDMYQMNTPLDPETVNAVRAVQTATGMKRKLAPVNEWESDQLFRNDSGKFTDVSKEAGINNRAYGLSTIIYDFNGDGWPDIFVANDYIDDDVVMINSGKGTFTDQSRRYLRHSSMNSMGSDMADLNNDGLEDLVTLDMLAEEQQRRKELESNMRPDRYGTLVRMGYSHQMQRNQLQLNNGQNFSEVGELAGIDATDWSWAPLLVDFDNDRNTDIFISNGYRYDLTDVDFISYTADSIMRNGGLSARTFDDFSTYLEMIPTQPRANYLYRNNGDLDFENVADRWNVGEPSYSSSAVYADLDNDGDVDLVVGNHERPPFVYRNEATAQNNDANWLQIMPGGYAKNTAALGLSVTLVVGDERISKTLQPSRGFLGSNQPFLHFGLGDARTVDRLEVTWPDGKTQLLTNVKAGQQLKLNYADAGSQTFASPSASSGGAAAAGAMFDFPQGQRGLDFVHQENQFNDFDRQFLQPRMTSREGPALAKADVNGDGREDIFLGGAAGKAAALYTQSASGNFARSAIFPAADNKFEDVGAVFFDADGDGDEDLYVTSGGSHAPAGDAVYTDRLYLNNNGTFARDANALPAATTCTGAVTTIDYDADGDVDLLVAGRVIPGSYPTAPRSYLLRNNGGRFEDVTASVFPAFVNAGMVTALAVGDLTGDATPEIVVAGEWMPVVTYAWNGEQFTAAPDGPSAGVGFWHSLLIDDLDGDGKNEVIAGNDGLNTRFHPDSDGQATLFASDFDGNGAVDPIVTFRDDNGDLVPIATKGMMIKQLPKLKKKYVRAATYSRATIGDVFSAAELQAATRYDLETVSTSVIRRSGDGWSVQALPRMAQVAPARSIRSADFNGDGLRDLLIVGNDYGMQVETGRVDAGNGTLLLNDGNGGWTFQPNIATGFWASLDARKVLPVALADGKKGWVVANSDGPAAIYVER